MPKQTPSMSDEAVRAKTGKGWDDWFTLLDAAGARAMPHKEIVALLSREHEVGPWWRQMVTVAYEQARGMREKHQTPSGYTANASRTIGAPVGRLFEAWNDEDLRRHWLPDELTVRKATPDRSLRITWQDGSNVDVNLVAKGEHRSQVAVEHAKLPDAEAVTRAKEHWKQALDRLQEALESHPDA